MHGQPSRRSHAAAAATPPFSDIQQINNALRNEAIPALERLAENPRLLDGARFERARLLEFFFSGHADSGARKFLGGPVGELRMEVVVRRNIKRRWQKLGVWDAAWGIADRETRLTVEGSFTDTTGRSAG